ncbi:Aldo/keto reductase [Schizopora paradoxa]|uniref:Aldo/keto reductase n=1 Tax=Schizopora paradoxa TaxID=27342 RepID=A0A0H2RZ50_9AGAM|nr:Aldo/keto reductase [Schizopora paradoxa]
MPFGSFKLNDGTEIPAIAFGTGSTMKGTDVTQYVEQALEHGFSHIDTAAYYQTEKYVGKAIREEGLKRSDMYITTKFMQMGIKQVDLYLIHNPRTVPGTIEEAWKEFEKIKEDGLSKSIGVSNFNLEQLQQLVKVAKVKPVVNQISFNPYNWKDIKELVKYSDSQGIITEAYSSLTPITRTPGGPVDPVLKSIGLRLGATPAQVIFSWVKSKGAVIVTTTTKVDRLHEYLEVADLPELTPEEVAAIEEAGAKGAPSGILITAVERLGEVDRSKFLIFLIAFLVTCYFTFQWDLSR